MKLVRSSDVVIKGLLDLIVKGAIKPGDRLPSTENIARLTGTSVLTAREAVRSLATIGLVEISHGRGMFLTEGPPVIEELLEARKVIESYSATMAALNIGPDELDTVEDLLNGMDRALERGDIDAFSEMDYEFHLSIAKSAGNRILYKTLDNIKDLLRYQQSTINKLPDIIHSSSLRHREIFEAIRRGDSAAAGLIMTRHIAEVIDSWKEHTGVAPKG